MSLEEILAEGSPLGGGESSSSTSMTSSMTQADVHVTSAGKRIDASGFRSDLKASGLSSRLTKVQMKKLQESMYHACESTNLDLTLDLRNFGVPWTLHTWLQTLQTANESQMISVINELLQDFSAQWPKENTSYFVDVGLPLLFAIFRGSKTVGKSRFSNASKKIVTAT